MSNEPEGGSYTIGKDGVRRRVDEPQKMPEGGGARDGEGKRLDLGAAPNQPAMPEAPQHAPWETPAPLPAPAVQPAGEGSEALDDKRRGRS